MKVTAERAVTLFTAGIASIVAAQGMYVMFSQALEMPVPLQLLCFAFIELMVVASAMRARRSQIDTGSAGVDGIAMWVLTILSGVLAASHATEDVGLLVLRLAAPLVAAWGWERSMALERRQITGAAGGMNWRISPRRLMVRWGLADPTDRTAGEVAVERRLEDLARAADAVRIARDTSNARGKRRAMQKLHRAIDKATSDGVVLGQPEIRARLADHLEGRFSAYSLPDYRPATNWADPASIVRGARNALDAIEPSATERAEFDALTGELDREIAAREQLAELEPPASTETDRAHTVPTPGDAERAPIARVTDDRSRANNPEPIAREQVEEAEPIAIDTDDRSRANPGADRDRHIAEILDQELTAVRQERRAGRSRANSVAPIAREDHPTGRAPIADHSPTELGTDRGPIADHTPDEEPTETTNEHPVAREPRPVVSLVRPAARASRAIEHPAPRAITSRPDRSQPAREPAVDGALARAVDRAPRAVKATAPIARDGDGEEVDRGPFAHELSRAQALDYARAVIDRELSRQPVEVLAQIFEARSRGLKANRIGKEIVGLPHSTVGRALTAVSKVTGPRAID
ncbi:hypothetical protein [Nocardia carnea]|uniref:hypothetical protein n=1 Tax=Nocardia carnea TaxID=37328 RepID=UPI002455817F|nr:hypothetical protein [Nocardia carnea]